MSYSIIVAKYLESLEWLKYMNLENIVVYDKSDTPLSGAIHRNNIGREGETFIYHIVKHYDDLPDYLIFIQGNPFDHMYGIDSNNFQNKLDELIKTVPTKPLPLFRNFVSESKDYQFIIILLVSEYFKYFFNEKLPDIYEYASGGQYIIPKNCILSNFS